MVQELDLVGRTVGGCRILAPLGEDGGQGRLFRAEDLEQESIRVALKVIRPAAARQPGGYERFRREATIPRLVEGHANIVRIYRSGTDPELDLPFIVMELFEGENVAHWLADCLRRGGAPPVAEAHEVLVQAARGVAALHGSRAVVVHRDLKPGNLFRHRAPGSLRVKVLDFGSATVLGTSAGLPALTEHGVRVPMTPGYAAPEQRAGAVAAPQADVFSLGVIGYELFAGHRPYSLLQEQALGRGGRTRPEALPAGVPAHVRAALERAVAPRPEDRFRDAQALLEALEQPERVPRRAAGWLAWPVAAAGLAALFFLALPAWRKGRVAGPPPPPPASPPVVIPFSPPPVEPRSWAAVSAREDSHLCALTMDGRAWCWGENAYGELGSAGGEAAIPRAVDGDLSFRGIHVGYRFTCGLTPAGEVHCWGDNSRGQLGSEGVLSSPAPRLVPLGAPIASLTVGRDHACAGTAGSEWYCWGNNAAEQLGAQTVDGAVVTVPISVVGHYRKLVAGPDFTCGLGLDGRASCWGRNDRGQLGNDGAGSGAAAPPVATTRDFGDLVSGPGRSCARDPAGHWFCWGDSDWGVLQNGAEGGSEASPAPMAAGWRWEEVALGADHGCGRTGAGQVWCWGSNARGQLGSPGASTSAPRQVDSRERFDFISAGAARACGLARTRLYCWGNVAGPDGLTQQRPLLIY